MKHFVGICATLFMVGVVGHEYILKGPAEAFAAMAGMSMLGLSVAAAIWFIKNF